MSPRPGLLPSLLIAAVLGAGGAARLPAAGQDDPIRTGIDLVTLDFTALGADGVPVDDLAPEDVTLKLNGRERPIKSLQYVHLAAPRVRTASAPPAELPLPFGTNYLGDAGRTVILVIENDSLRPAVGRHTIDAAADFVGQLSPRDRVALVTTPLGGLLADLSRDHRRLRELLASISGKASQRATESEKSCRTRDTLNALRGMLEGLTHVDVPKTIVFVSGGILTARRDAPLTAPPGPCEIRSVNYEEVGQAAIAARANFYVIKADDLVIDPATNAFADPTASRFRSSDEELAGMESLAGVTNGTLLRVTPSDAAAFGQVIRETSGYYLAAFEPDPGERNGLSHRVEIAVARPGVHVRVRPRVVIPRPASRRTPPAPTPQAMLRDWRTYRDLPIRAAAFASANPGGDSRLKIVAVAEPLDRLAPLASASFGLFDARGRLVAQWTANERELASVPVASAGLAAPGTYRLRVAAVDALGRRGASDYEFEAEVASGGPVTMSMLVLGVSRRGFTPRLQFSGEPTAMGFFEVYGSMTDPSAFTVAFELATAPDARPVLTVPGILTATRAADLHRATGVVPLGVLPPGDYIVRGVISLHGEPIGEVSRTLRKAIY